MSFVDTCDGRISPEIYSQIYAASRLFDDVAAEALASSLQDAVIARFERGELLTCQGDAANELYLILAGVAEVVIETGSGGEELVDLLVAGDVVGELAILLDGARTATVRALRECHVVKISGADFMRLHGRSPQFALNLARHAASRLQRTTHRRSRRRPIMGVLAVTHSPQPHVKSLADGLIAAFARRNGEHLATYACGSDEQPELSRNLKRSDAVVILVDAAIGPDAAGIGRILTRIAGVQPLPRVFLALCHADGIAVGAAAEWADLPGIERHLHLSGPGDDVNLSRLVRLIDGTAIGLALGGGGARGFAHIGVLKALEAAGIPVDFICGTSMGAIIAGQYAAGFGVRQIIANVRRNYVEASSLADLHFPRVSLYSGRATARRLKALFGDAAIEDLPLPFFAVAADLCSAEPVALDRGPVWQALKISSSIPGMLPPTRLQGRLLVDGALLDNLPVGALGRRLSGRIIASDVSVAHEFADLASPEAKRLPDFGQILMRATQLASVKHSRDAGSPADLYLNPLLNDVGMSEMGRIDEIIARGHAHASAQLAIAGWTI